MGEIKLLPEQQVVTSGEYFSVSELAAMRLPDKPISRKSWYALVVREGWPWIEVPCKGGPKGHRRDYLPPFDVAELIAARKREGAATAPGGGYVAPASNGVDTCSVASPGPPEYPVNRPLRAGAVDAELLGRVLVACSAVLGRDYDAAPAGDQAVAAAGVYNALLQMVAHLPRGTDALRRLDQEGLNSLMHLLLQMGVIQPVPKSQSGG